MHQELSKVLRALSILSLLASSCGPATPVKPIPTPLSPDQQQRLGDILSIVMPSQCRNPETVSLASQAPRNENLYPVGCTTIFAGNENPQILCVDPAAKSDIELTYLFAHESAHSCGERSLVEEPIQIILNYQVSDTLFTTITRNINDQEDGAPYIDLTVITQEKDKQTKGFFPFEEMIAYYFALILIEADFGIYSSEYSYAEKNDIHNNSTHVIDTLFKSAETSFDEIAYLKRRADANGLIDRLQQGLINVGLQYGLIDENRPSDPNREKYYLLEYINNAYNALNFNVDDLSDNYRDFMKNSLSHFYFGQNINSLTEEQINLINKIFLSLFGDSQPQGYFPQLPVLAWQEMPQNMSCVGDGAIADQIVVGAEL